MRIEAEVVWELGAEDVVDGILRNKKINQFWNATSFQDKDDLELNWMRES